jgi:hypothetical protein
MIHELRNTIAVHTPLGLGTAIAWIDYGCEVNTVWKIRLNDGRVRNFYDDDILMYENKMNGEPEIIIPKTWKK